MRVGREENKSQPQSLFPSSYVMVFNPASSASSDTSLSTPQSTYGLTVLTSVTMSLSILGLEVMQTTCSVVTSFFHVSLLKSV